MVEIIPDHAHVVVDDGKRIYVSPVYVMREKPNGWETLRFTTAGEAKNRGYKPDPRSQNGGYFIGRDEAQFFGWLEDLGLYKRNSRWNADGTWNW